MAVNDYLQGINNATSGQKTDVSNAAKDLATLQAGEGSLPAKLKEALNTKLNNNKDIINQQADTMQTYFNSGADARAKYQDVFNPFEKAKLVQQDRSMALRPYDVLSGVLQNRMGSVNDIVSSGIQGWQGLVNAASTKADLAKTNLAQALQAYLTASNQQQGQDQMSLDVAKTKEASRQFEKNYGLDVTKVNNQASQFAQELATKLKIAGMSSSGGGGGSISPTDVTALATYLSGLDPTLQPNAIPSYTTDKNIGAVLSQMNTIAGIKKYQDEQKANELNAKLEEQRKNGPFAKFGNWVKSAGSQNLYGYGTGGYLK